MQFYLLHRLLEYFVERRLKGKLTDYRIRHI